MFPENPDKPEIPTRNVKMQIYFCIPYSSSPDLFAMVQKYCEQNPTCREFCYDPGFKFYACEVGGENVMV